METSTKELALQLLVEETEKVYKLINSQKEHLCFAACPALDRKSVV